MSVSVSDEEEIPTTTTAITTPAISTADDNNPETTTNQNISILQICTFPPDHTFSSVSKDIRSQAVGASVNAVLSFASTTILLMAVGNHFDTNTFAALGVGISLYNVLCLSVLTGWSSALDTLCSIAYGKDKKSAEVGTWTKIGVGLTILVCIPISIIFVFFSDPLVRFVFGDTYADNGASEFLQHSVLSVFLFGIQSCISRSLQAQHLAQYPMRGTVVSTAVTFVSSITLLPAWGKSDKKHGPPQAVAYTMALSYLTLLLSMIVMAPKEKALFRKVSWNIFPCCCCCRASSDLVERKIQLRREADQEEMEMTSTAVAVAEVEHKTTTTTTTTTAMENDDDVDDEPTSPSKRVSLNEHQQLQQQGCQPSDESISIHHHHHHHDTSFWSPFSEKERMIKFCILGYESTAAGMLEWFPFEANFFFVAALSESDVAAYNIYINLATIVYSVSNGISVAASSWVGKLVGEGKGTLALVYGRHCVVWAVCCACIACLLLLGFHSAIFRLYTKDEMILAKVTAVLPALFLHHICDNCQFTLIAVYRGVGRQGLTIKVLLLTLWLVGDGCSFLFSQKLGMGLLGVTLGFAMGFLVEIPLLIYTMYWWDWEEIASRERQLQHHVHDDGEQQLQQEEDVLEEINEK